MRATRAPILSQERTTWSALLPLTLLILLLGTGCRTAVPNSLATHDSSRWEKEIAVLEARDLTNPPPKDCIVFVGSSSIKRWTNLVADFPGFPVVNHGFG